MQQDQFLSDFFQIFEPQFQQAIRQLPTASHDTSFDADLLSTFLDPIAPYVKTGKRIRPFLIAVGADSLGHKVCDAGIAFELVHTFALVHDDIMDGATLRRNVPTVHVAFNQQGLSGESGALLVGDFLLACANEYMAEHVPELMPVFTKMQRFLCIGQFYEMIHWGKSVQPEVSQNIARFKSAQYSFMYPLQYGLQLAGRDIHLLDGYADAAGLAFQVRDDWLDVSEDSQSGKDNNLDSKNSVPNMVQNLLKQHDNDLKTTKTAVEKQLSDYRKNAIQAIDSISLSDKQKKSLISLLEFSTTI